MRAHREALIALRSFWLLLVHNKVGLAYTHEVFFYALSNALHSALKICAARCTARWASHTPLGRGVIPLNKTMHASRWAFYIVHCAALRIGVLLE